MFDWIIKPSDITQVCDSLPTINTELCSGGVSSLLNKNKNKNKNDANKLLTDEKKYNTPVAAPADDLQQLRSNPSVVDRCGSSKLSSVSISDNNNNNNNLNKKSSDQRSIGSDTLPDGSDDDDDDDDNNNKGDRQGKRRFSWTYVYVAVALLALFLIGLSSAFIVRNRINSKSSTSSIDNATKTNIDNDNKNEDVISATPSDVSVSEDIAGAGNEDGNNNYDYTSNTNYLVGAYYYPWHGDSFHNNDGYLRQDLIPPQQPALGEYNDSNKQVITQHMKWFRQSNIGLLVTSWWGPNRLEDKNTRNVIMEHEDIGNLKIALHYETTGRIKDNSDMSVARSDMQYICNNYFDHPNYYKINGRPVLVMYITRKLHTAGVLEEAILTMRSEASKCGHNVYLIGDQVFQTAPDPDEVFVPFWYFDAVTNYDVYGSNGRPEGYVGKEAVDNYYSEQEKWREQAIKENCRYIPSVSPGYNDRSVRLENDHPPLSRRVTADSEEGSLFWYQLKKALPLVDPMVDNIILVNSFNEWHEDTQIEPAVRVNSASASSTTEPENLTGGLEYTAYGELYLDILGAATSKYEDADIFDHLL
ncbi:MAG: glycoprotein endo-alpha-1,2-mannosidase [Bacillariaceae sp.]|jgi:glycoprotein endo-alpha-1,2-mannosidase